jgi:hypothetical protein
MTDEAMIPLRRRQSRPKLAHGQHPSQRRHRIHTPRRPLAIPMDPEPKWNSETINHISGLITPRTLNPRIIETAPCQRFMQHHSPRSWRSWLRPMATSTNARSS